MRNEGKKKNKLDIFLNMFIVLVLLFLTYQWNDDHQKVQHYEQVRPLEIEYQLNELHAAFFSIEETLSTYDFPIGDDMRVYYQDALDNDIQRLNHVGHTIQQLNEYPNFIGINKDYIARIEEIMKGLRGFKYSDQEKNSAIEALNKVQSELYSLLESRDFSVEKETDREKVLAALEQFIEELSVLKRY
ncbi:hypothetical protein ACOJQI_12470 [Bacillus salacetis]|uniref:hypothetical protein n=1 Tax=Bacillus salacetis TaxID=2315464 RepID=UPI003BA37649